MRRRTRFAAAGLTVVLAACGSGGTKPGASGTSPSPSPSTSASITPTPGASTSVAPKPTSSSSASKTPSPAPAGTGPSPVALPWTPDPSVHVQASVTPACVLRGGTATLKVHTEPKAAVGWQAIYSDSNSGAPYPYGAGYGGNSGGIANGEGNYSSVWVVSARAPSGPGRVDVIVGWNSLNGYGAAPFAVAGNNGRC